MANHTTLRSLFSAIASAIRAKTGGSADIVADDFPTAISAIPTGIIPRGTKPITITENGVVTEDVTNYASAEITTDVVGYKIYNDGKTHVYVALNPAKRKIGLNFCVNGTLTIDWGDGSTSQMTGSSLTTKAVSAHEYAEAGTYHIRVTAESGSTYAIPAVDGTNQTLITNRNGFSGLEHCIPLRFVECGDAKIDVMNGTTKYSQGLFRNARGLQSVVLPNNGSYLGNYMFNSLAALVEIKIPDTVTSLGDYCFNGCIGLGVLTIPAAVIDIGAYALSGLSGIYELHFMGATPPIVASSSAFDGLPTKCKIYVPSGSLSAYTSASNYPSTTSYTYIEE